MQNWNGRQDGYFITDQNSTNGTYVNGERLEAYECRKLHTADEIYFASLGIMFWITASNEFRILYKQEYMSYDLLNKLFGGRNEMDELKAFLKSRSVLNLTIVIINILVFFLLDFTGNTENAQFMTAHGACYAPWVIERGEYYRLFTCMFLHFGIEHLFNNMLSLLFLGDLLEKLIGKWRYLLIYFAGGVGSSLISVFWELNFSEPAVSAGASGAIFAVIGALVFLADHPQRNDSKCGQAQTVPYGSIVCIEGFTTQGVDQCCSCRRLCTWLCTGSHLCWQNDSKAGSRAV